VFAHGLPQRRAVVERSGVFQKRSFRARPSRISRRSEYGRPITLLPSTLNTSNAMKVSGAVVRRMMSQPRRLRTRSDPSVETIARNPSHLTSKA
jgi:hypothetical protein